jgi:hypothetical protein
MFSKLLPFRWTNILIDYIIKEVALLQHSFGVAPNKEKTKTQLIDFYISGIKA